MEPSRQRFSRPVYEGLPWFYVVCGIAALVASYLLPSGLLGVLIGAAGLAALLGGFVILLRRRDYREMRSQYADPDSLNLASRTEKDQDAG